VDLATRSICVIAARIAQQNLNLLCEHWHTILLKADSMNSNKKSILVAASASAAVSTTLLIISNHFIHTRKRLASDLDEEEDLPRYRTPLDYTVFTFYLDSWSEERCWEYFRYNAVIPVLAEKELEY